MDDHQMDSPLTCYICGETSDKRCTYGRYGCLKNQKEAAIRFEEKHNKKPQHLLDICPSCKHNQHRMYINNIKKKYGIHQKIKMKRNHMDEDYVTGTV